MRAVQITRFGGLEAMDVVDLPDPVPGDGEQLFDLFSSGVDVAMLTTRCRPLTSGATSRGHPGTEKETPAHATVLTRRAGHRGRHT